MKDHFLKESLIGEEWMALRQIASGGKAAAITQSVQTRLVVLGLIIRDHYGRLNLTERGRKMIETPDNRNYCWLLLVSSIVHAERATARLKFAAQLGARCRNMSLRLFSQNAISQSCTSFTAAQISIPQPLHVLRQT
jgi:hypothetical protein